MKKLVYVEGLRILQTLVVFITTFFTKNEYFYPVLVIRIMLGIYLIYLVFFEIKIISKRIKRIFENQFQKLKYEELKPTTWWILGILFSITYFGFLDIKELNPDDTPLFIIPIFLLFIIKMVESNFEIDYKLFGYEIKKVSIPITIISSIITRKLKNCENSEEKIEIYKRLLKNGFLESHRYNKISFIERRNNPYFDDEEVLKFWITKKLPSLERKIEKRYEEEIRENKRIYEIKEKVLRMEKILKNISLE